MKILFCYYLPSGGTETLNRQREKALKLINIESHFLYLQTGAGIINPSTSKVFIANKDLEIKRIIEDEKYDAVAVNSDALLLRRIRALGYQGPLIFESQGFGPKREANKFLKYTAKENINDFSDALLYPKTPHLQQLMKEIFPNKKQFAIHNCIDTEAFSYRNQPKQPFFIIGWVGRIEPNKNWNACLKIVKRLLPDFPNLQLWMFIDDTLTTPNERKKFNHQLQQLQLKNNLNVYNNVPHSEMPNYYSTIAASGGFLLSTSISEGFGYAVLEALSCKCPVLTSNSDGVQSFVFHNVTGKMYSQHNLNEAVNEAKDLMTNVTLRNTMTANGSTFVKEHFSLENYAQHFKKMLEDLVK